MTSQNCYTAQTSCLQVKEKDNFISKKSLFVTVYMYLKKNNLDKALVRNFQDALGRNVSHRVAVLASTLSLFVNPFHIIWDPTSHFLQC